MIETKNVGFILQIIAIYMMGLGCGLLFSTLFFLSIEINAEKWKVYNQCLDTFQTKPSIGLTVDNFVQCHNLANKFVK